MLKDKIVATAKNKAKILPKQTGAGFTPTPTRRLTVGVSLPKHQRIWCKGLQSKRGFTLIELLVVISIISLLASVLLATVSDARKRARDARRFEDMHAIAIAVQLFYEDHGDMPGPNNGGPDGYGTHIGTGGPLDSALAPYMGKVPKDPLDDGVNYFYGYDPSHCVLPPGTNLCYLDTDYCGNIAERWQTVVSVERFEAVPLDKLQRDTCGGGDQDILNAQYNVVLGPENSVARGQ